MTAVFDALFFYASQTLKIMYKWLTRLLLFIVRLTNGILLFTMITIAAGIIAVFTIDMMKNDSVLTVYIINMMLANGVSAVFRHFYGFMSSTGLITHVPYAIAGTIFLLFLIKAVLRRMFRNSFAERKNVRLIIHNILKLVVNTLIVLLSCVFYFNFVFTGYVDSIFSGDEVFGKGEYLRKLQLVEDQINNQKAGAIIALNKVMFDVAEDLGALLMIGDAEYTNFCRQINSLIDQTGGPNTAVEHYFRNKLNRAPQTLDEMLELMNQGGDWRLMEPSENLFHMNGKDGEYNVKFISGSGFLEAVYNRHGELLTEQNDPLNMGTYNYADPITDASKHGLYDVAPYFMWGNDEAGISKPSVDSREDNLAKFNQNPGALVNYERIKEKIKR